MYKLSLLLLLLVVTTALCGQTRQEGTVFSAQKFRTLNDSVPQVIYNKPPDTSHPIAWFVNNQWVEGLLIKSINPESIATMNVQKQPILMNQIKFDGQVYLTLKSDHQPKYITLKELKSTFTNLGESPVVYLLDGEVVLGDEQKNRVDQGNILQIIIDKIDAQGSGTDIFLIRVFTRSPENIKRSKEIRIR